MSTVLGGGGIWTEGAGRFLGAKNRPPSQELQETSSQSDLLSRVERSGCRVRSSGSSVPHERKIEFNVLVGDGETPASVMKSFRLSGNRSGNKELQSAEQTRGGCVSLGNQPPGGVCCSLVSWTFARGRSYLDLSQGGPGSFLRKPFRDGVKRSVLLGGSFSLLACAEY